MIRILLYEDSEDLREAMVLMIKATPDIELAASFSHCVDVVKHLDDYQPDVILMDIEMPGMDGLEGTRLIKEKDSKVQVIILTVFEDEERLFSALKNGASGYFVKGEPPLQILEGIRIVHEGGSTMSPVIARKVFNYFKPTGNAEKLDLSVREKEILQLLVAGDSYKEIAGKLYISLETVRTHIKHIYEKMQVRSKSQAVGKALKDRLFGTLV